MNAAVIIDIAIVLVLAGFTAYGAKRGLFQSLAGLVIVVVALFGAAMIAGTFAAPAAKVVTPVVEKYFSQRLNAVWGEILEDSIDLQSIGADDFTGLPAEEFLANMMESAGKTMSGAVDSAAGAVAAVTESLVQSFAYGVLFILAFILLLILLRVLCAAMGLLTKLPGVHGLNAVGGAVFGLVEGALLVFLMVFMLRNLGVTLDAEELQNAHILRIFRENTPLSILFSLL